MSPREMSRSSSSRSAIDIGAHASANGPSNVSTDAMRVSSPHGSTSTGSPARNTPAAIWPA